MPKSGGWCHLDFSLSYTWLQPNRYLHIYLYWYFLFNSCFWIYRIYLHKYCAQCTHCAMPT